jgi:hypothetical protein
MKESDRKRIIEAYLRLHQDKKEIEVKNVVCCENCKHCIGVDSKGYPSLCLYDIKGECMFVAKEGVKI